MNRPKFLFGDIVVVDDEFEFERYRVRHKYLSEEELEWQRG